MCNGVELGCLKVEYNYLNQCYLFYFDLKLLIFIHLLTTSFMMVIVGCDSTQYVINSCYLTVVLKLIGAWHTAISRCNIVPMAPTVIVTCWVPIFGTFIIRHAIWDVDDSKFAFFLSLVPPFGLGVHTT